MSVDASQRVAKMRAHSATHLLHFALDTMLSWTKQAWSLVDNDLLRFDFAAKKPLSNEQLKELQVQINNRIRWWYTISVQELSLDEAKKLWAKAFFEDKYGDIVRVVSVSGKNSTPLHSVELCGWTHCASTSDIWAFVIVSQEAVASWIRRITAATGPWVSDFALSCTDQLELIAWSLSCQPKQITEKIEKLTKELDAVRNEYSSLETSLITNTLQTLPEYASDQFSYIINTSESALSKFDFKATVQQAKQLRSDKNRILFTTEGTFALYRGATNDAKNIAQTHWLKWWWSDQLVQWRDPSITTLFS